MAQQHLLFEAGGLLLAAPAELIKAIHEQLNIQSVSGTRHWFLGLAVAHGKLLPVTDLGGFCARRSSSGRTLELADAIGSSGLQVDSVYGLSDRPLTDVALDGVELLQPGVEKLALSARAVVQDERIHRLLDVAALVQSPAFLNIAETSH